MPILLFLAAAPAVALMIYIYKKDSVEKEPVGLLAKLVYFGALSVIFAVIVELILGYIVNLCTRYNAPRLYRQLLCSSTHRGIG